jgi:hypothetical protein
MDVDLNPLPGLGVPEEEERVRHAPRHSRQASSWALALAPSVFSAVVLKALLICGFGSCGVAEQGFCSPCSSPASSPTRSRTALAGRAPTSSGDVSPTECR